MSGEPLIGSGCVMAIGGNEDKRAGSESILARFVRRAGGAAARIVIIPSASMAPRERAQRYTRIFTKLRVADLVAVHTELDATPEERQAIRNATGIFVTGGDQARLMNCLRASGCVTPIVEAVRGGAVYAGTSAGASALSQRMIARSKRRKGTDEIEYDEGLGLMPHLIIDQHFGERRRLSRLLAASKTYQMTGIGIDENTALVWSPDGQITVEGAGEVTILAPSDSPNQLMNPQTQTYRLQILRNGAQLVSNGRRRVV